MARFSAAIAPPSAEEANSGFRVAAFAVREQAVLRATINIVPDCQREVDSTTLGKGSPLVYGLR